MIINDNDNLRTKYKIISSFYEMNKYNLTSIFNIMYKERWTDEITFHF